MESLAHKSTNISPPNCNMMLIFHNLIKSHNFITNLVYVMLGGGGDSVYFWVGVWGVLLAL